MKGMNMLIWLTQLGISVIAPMGVFAWLGFWLRSKFELGVWVVLLFCALGFLCAGSSFRQSLRMMEQMDKHSTRKQEPPPVSFNNHE